MWSTVATTGSRVGHNVLDPEFRRKPAILQSDGVRSQNTQGQRGWFSAVGPVTEYSAELIKHFNGAFKRIFMLSIRLLLIFFTNLYGLVQARARRYIGSVGQSRSAAKDPRCGPGQT